MDEWLKEYTAKLAEANGISMDGPAENGHAENGGGDTWGCMYPVGARTWALNERACQRVLL